MHKGYVNLGVADSDISELCKTCHHHRKTVEKWDCDDGQGKHGGVDVEHWCDKKEDSCLDSTVEEDLSNCEEYFYYK